MTENAEIAVDPVHDEAAHAPGPAEQPTRRGLTPRQAFTLLAVALALMLIALIIYLLLTLSPKSFSAKGGTAIAGIKPVLVIEGPGTGKRPRFDRPMGAAFGRDGRIYVADTGNNRVCVFDKRGTFLFEFGGFGVGKPLAGIKPTWKEGLMNFPVGIDVDDRGRVYVADFRNDQVQVFDTRGKFLAVFPDRMAPTGRGSSGQDGGGIAVTDVAAGGDRVYATDTFQIFEFTIDGKLVGQFGKPGAGSGDLDHPNGVAATPDGTVYVSDSNHNRVTAFNEKGKALWNVGAPVGMTDPAKAATEVTRTATPEETLGLPRGLTVLDDGSLIVADAFDFQLVHISPTGRIMGRYGQRGVRPAEINFANDVDSLGDLLLVADKENNRVQVVELVRKAASRGSD